MVNKKTVFKAALGLSLVSILSKLLGFAREQAIAWRFGAGAAVDAYVAALVIPTIISGVVGGALSTAFLPVYSEWRNTAKGKRLAGSVSWLNSLLGLLGSIAALYFAPFLVRVLVGNFPPEQQKLTVELLRILSFGTLLMSVSFFLTMLFNSHQLFLLPALNPVIQNVIIVVGVLAFGAAGIVGVAYAALIAMVLPVVLLFCWALYKNYPILVRPKFLDPQFSRVLRLSVPIFVAGLFGQLYVVVDRRLASGLDIGSIAALNFANRLVQLPFGIFVMALSTAVFPTLADLAARGDKKAFAEALVASLRGLLLLLVPASVGLLVLREPIVRLAFERGSFDAADTAKTALALGFYALGLLGLSAGTVMTRAFYSLQDTLTPVKIGALTALLNALLAVLLVGPLEHGGLALANSLGVSLSALLLLVLLRKKLGPVPMGLLPLLGKVMLCSLCMGIVSHFVYALFSPSGELISLAAAMGGGVAVYGAGILAMRVDEVSWILNKFRQRTRL